VSLSVAAFSALAPHLRNDGTPMYSLLRNLGASVGISLSQSHLPQSTAQARTQLTWAITPYEQAVQNLPGILQPHARPACRC